MSNMLESIYFSGDYSDLSSDIIIELLDDDSAEWLELTKTMLGESYNNKVISNLISYFFKNSQYLSPKSRNRLIDIISQSPVLPLKYLLTKLIDNKTNDNIIYILTMVASSEAISLLSDDKWLIEIINLGLKSNYSPNVVMALDICLKISAASPVIDLISNSGDEWVIFSALDTISQINSLSSSEKYSIFEKSLKAHPTFTNLCLGGMLKSDIKSAVVYIYNNYGAEELNLRMKGYLASSSVSEIKSALSSQLSLSSDSRAFDLSTEHFDVLPMALLSILFRLPIRAPGRLLEVMLNPSISGVRLKTLDFVIAATISKGLFDLSVQEKFLRAAYDYDINKYNRVVSSCVEKMLSTYGASWILSESASPYKDFILSDERLISEYIVELRDRDCNMSTDILGELPLILKIYPSSFLVSETITYLIYSAHFKSMNELNNLHKALCGEGLYRKYVKIPAAFIFKALDLNGDLSTMSSDKYTGAIISVIRDKKVPVDTLSKFKILHQDLLDIIFELDEESQCQLLPLIINDNSIEFQSLRKIFFYIIDKPYFKEIISHFNKDSVDTLYYMVPKNIISNRRILSNLEIISGLF